MDLLAVQGTLKSLLQDHSSKISILRCSAFFYSQFSHPYITTGKTIALTRWTFVGKVMSLLCNMLFFEKPLSCVQHFVTPWTVAHQAPPSINFLGMSTGVGCHFLLQGILPTQGLSLGLPHCGQMLLASEPPGNPNMLSRLVLTFFPMSKHLLTSCQQSPLQ